MWSDLFANYPIVLCIIQVLILDGFRQNSGCETITSTASSIEDIFSFDCIISIQLKEHEWPDNGMFD